jgi:hypothetical protein
MPARVSLKLHARLEAVPTAVRNVARKAYVRLCNRIGGSRRRAKQRPW